MVDFREELRPASFRGIAFELVDDDVRGGRRLVTHEYPGRDEPSHEDMGGQVRAFSFRAYVIGSGFVARALALEEAFLQGGVGTLIHPHYGELRVHIRDCMRQHSISEIGSAAFNVSVEKAGADSGGLSVLDDTARKLTDASDGMFDRVGEDFLQSLAKGVFPSFVTEDGLGRVQSFISAAQGVFANYGLSGGFSSFDVDSLLSYTGLNSSLVSSLISLFRDTAATARPQAASVIGSTTSSVEAENPDQVKLVKALASLSDTSMDIDNTSSSPSRIAIAQNAAAITTFMQTNTLAAAGTAARYATYESREQAMEVRDLLADKLVTLRARQLTDGLLPAARATTDMLVAVSEDINEQLGRLPRTIRIQSKSVRPSLAIAYRLYGSDPSIVFDRADDIVSRNRIAHPGFVGVKPVEVLIDG